MSSPSSSPRSLRSFGGTATDAVVPCAPRSWGGGVQRRGSWIVVLGALAACSAGRPVDPGGIALEVGPTDAEIADAREHFAEAGLSDGGVMKDGRAGDVPPPRPMGFVDVTDAQLPPLLGFCMDAAPIDVEGDGDLDLILAQEFRENILLINDGGGVFVDESSRRLPRERRDSEDIATGDFDGDGDLDAFIASEDDRVNELYINDGTGVFTARGDLIPVRGVSNAVVAMPLDGDARPDLVLGNAGINEALVSAPPFRRETDERLPSQPSPTQDLEAGDVDGDGDLDLVVVGEGTRALWRNDGQGRFSAVEGALAPRADVEETREAELGDVDGDGDVDLLLANIRFILRDASRQNRLLINDGTGRFVDETTARLPADDDDSFDIELIDLDGDGDLDVLTANMDTLSGARAEAPYRALVNDGRGYFRESATLLPTSARGNGFDIVAEDFTGDGHLDLFLCSRGGADRLLVGRR